jgi:hypothetical protein
VFRSSRLALPLIAALLAVAAPALAQPGGNGKAGGGSDTSSIAIATVNSGTLSPLTGSATVAYGDSLTFATSVERLAGWEYPMVALSCYQDGHIVLGLLNTPDATFMLAGSSQWEQNGGDATCHADLDAYGWKGGQESIRVLATTGDWPASWPS